MAHLRPPEGDEVNTPSLTDPALLVTAIAAALRGYCDPGYPEEIARNSVQALIAGDGTSPAEVIRACMMRRVGHVWNTAKASESAAVAYAVAERPESQRAHYLIAIGVNEPRAWLRAHGLLGVETRVCA